MVSARSVVSPQYSISIIGQSFIKFPICMDNHMVSQIQLFEAVSFHIFGLVEGAPRRHFISKREYPLFSLYIHLQGLCDHTKTYPVYTPSGSVSGVVSSRPAHLEWSIYENAIPQICLGPSSLCCR